MSDKRVQISRRRFLGSVALIGGASAAAGAGTMAAFTDTESSDDNRMTAGSLDLVVGDETSTQFSDISDIAPGESRSDSVKIQNSGTIPGTLQITLEDLSYPKNGSGGSENGNSNANTQTGELQDFLYVRAKFGESSVTQEWTPVSTLSEGQTFDTGETIPGTTTKTLTVEWEFRDEEEDNPNVAQGDGVEIDVTFRLVQSGGS